MSDPTFRQLSVVLRVAEHGSAGEVARVLGVSKGYVSRTVALVERYYGVSLFANGGSGLKVTRVGAPVIQRIAASLAEIAHARMELRENGARAGKLVIGATPVARGVLVPRGLARVLDKEQAADIAIFDDGRDKLIDRLAIGAVDIVVSGLPGAEWPSGVSVFPLFDDRLIIVARASHPVFADGRGDLRAAAQYRWILPREESSTVPRRIAALLESHGAQFALPPMSADMGLNRGYLLETDCFAVVSEHRYSRELAAGSVREFVVAGGADFQPVGYAVRSAVEKPALLQSFIEALKIVGAEIGTTDQRPYHSAQAVPDLVRRSA